MFFRPTCPNFFAFEAGNRVIIFFFGLNIWHSAVPMASGLTNEALDCCIRGPRLEPRQRQNISLLIPKFYLLFTFFPHRFVCSMYD
jgi:hypothetical protein